jgi:hypothetical protein
MRTKNLKGTVSIESIGNSTRLRWRLQKKRFLLHLFTVNKPNLLRAKKIALQIEQDMADEEFDITLTGINHQHLKTLLKKVKP